jgi:thiosulfate/3-mercaptopyruvate sulfurtransferase
MTLEIPSSLVGVSWLDDHIGHDKLIVMDASVPPVVPGFVSINTEENFSAIPGARRFDYDKKVCKPDSSLPHMMPSEELFQQEARKLGIDDDSVIVFYDDVGIYASPRAWWMMRAMGHRNVAVLDGGLPAWVEAGLPVQDELSASEQTGNFRAKDAGALFCDFDEVLGAIENPSCCIVDARSSGRFFGTAPEPRPGTRSGHMPGAKNLPFAQVLNQGRMKSAAELKKLYEPIAKPGQRVITSCGSGITACVLTLAAELAGYPDLIVYDGSWAEWGAPSKLPVVLEG